MSKTLNDLKYGDTVEIPVKSEWQSRFGKVIVMLLADKRHAGYPEESAALICRDIIQYLPFDAKEPENPDPDISQKGNNQYDKSNVLQWMNSNAEPGKWYSPKHKYDAPPTRENVFEQKNPYDQLPGLLYVLDPKFVSNLMETTVDSVKSKIFLIDSSKDDLEYFKSHSFRPIPTNEAKLNSEFIKKEELCFSRTPISYNNASVDVLNSSDSSSAYNGSIGICFSANLPLTFAVSDEPNADGNYTIYSAPKISGKDETLGDTIDGNLLYEYTVSQPEGGNVTVKEIVDNTVIKTIDNAPLNVGIVSTAIKTAFNTLGDGAHTLKIEASVGSYVSVRTLTFTKKTLKGFYIELKNPLKASTQPKRCNITVNRNIPEGATFRCEVTNNPYDDNPVWEDCTEAVEGNMIYAFHNKTNVAPSYGLNVRVTVNKGTAKGASVSSIGGAFD